MATVTDRILRDGITVLVYDNGMERNADTGHIIKPPPATLITPENTSDFYRLRLEKKRERLMAGAAKALERTGEWETPNDMDVVEAIGEVMMERALDDDYKNAKQVRAAKLLLEEGFMSVAPTPQNEKIFAGEIAASASALMELARRIEAEIEARLARERAIDIRSENTGSDG